MELLSLVIITASFLDKKESGAGIFPLNPETSENDIYDLSSALSVSYFHILNNGF